MRQILGIDPGGTTGAVLIEWTGDPSLDPSTVSILDSWQLDFDAVPTWAADYIPTVDIVAIERYFITGNTIKKSRQMEALYVIGGALFLAELSEDSPEVVMQAASVAKNAWPNQRLKDVFGGGTKLPIVGRHAHDALRHALLACHDYIH